MITEKLTVEATLESADKDALFRLNDILGALISYSQEQSEIIIGNMQVSKEDLERYKNVIIAFFNADKIIIKDPDISKYDEPVEDTTENSSPSMNEMEEFFSAEE